MNRLTLGSLPQATTQSQKLFGPIFLSFPFQSLCHCRAWQEGWSRFFYYPFACLDDAMEVFHAWPHTARILYDYDSTTGLLTRELEQHGGASLGCRAGILDIGRCLCIVLVSRCQ